MSKARLARGQSDFEFDNRGGEIAMKRTQRISAIIVMAGLAVLGQTAFASLQGSFERTLQVSGPVDLEVLSRSGNITIRSGPAGTVRISGKIHVGDRWFSGERSADVHQIEQNPPIRQNGNIVRIDYVSMRNISVDYELTVPADTALRTRDGSGDQDIQDLHGRVDLQSGSGNMELRNLTGEVRLDTGSGDVRAQSISGPFTAKSGSGNIHLEEVGTGEVRVRTGSGDMELRGVNGALTADAGSGNIRADGTPSGTWRLQTGSGDATLNLPEQSGFDLDLNTGSGDVVTNHPVSVTVQGRVQEGRRSLSGKVRGGGALVSVHTGSGNIRVD